MIDIIKPKRPIGGEWKQRPAPPAWVSMGFAAEAWLHPESNLCVISAVEVAKAEGGIDKGPEYHVSISRNMPGGHPERCTSAEAIWTLAQFEMLDAEEDNHVPNGKVRNFWRPVAARLVGLECDCKDEEPAMRENKGDYVWRGVR